MGDVGIAAFLLGTPAGGFLVEAARSDLPLAFGAVVLLMFCSGVLAVVCGEDDAEADAFLLVVTPPSAAIGVVALSAIVPKTCLSPAAP